MPAFSYWRWEWCFALKNYIVGFAIGSVLALEIGFSHIPLAGKTALLALQNLNLFA